MSYDDIALLELLNFDLDVFTARGFLRFIFPFLFRFHVTLEQRTCSLIHSLICYSLAQQNPLDCQFCWDSMTDSYSILCQNMLISSIVKISGMDLFFQKQEICVCI